MADTGQFSKIYKMARYNLTGTPTLLEVKLQDDSGLISYSTRGQVGLSNIELKATTGLSVAKDKALQIVQETLKSPDKSYMNIRKGLRSADSIIKKGGHVTTTTTQVTFNAMYDNRRLVEDVVDFDPTINHANTAPITSTGLVLISHALTKSAGYKYEKHSQVSVKKGKYVNKDESYSSIFYRTIVRLAVHKPQLLGRTLFKRSEIVEMLAVLGKEITPNYVSLQKQYPYTPNLLVRTQETELLVSRLHSMYPSLDTTSLFK